MFSNAVKSALQPCGLRENLGDGSGQRGLAVVNVTDGADVNMRLSALKLFLGHEALLFQRCPFGLAFIPKWPP